MFQRIIISGLNKRPCLSIRNPQAHDAGLTPVREDDFEENLPALSK
jgi:hypothetical protein